MSFDRRSEALLVEDSMAAIRDAFSLQLFSSNPLYMVCSSNINGALSRNLMLGDQHADAMRLCIERPLHWFHSMPHSPAVRVRAIGLLPRPDTHTPVHMVICSNI